jgi:hypothetical protein
MKAQIILAMVVCSILFGCSQSQQQNTSENEQQTPSSTQAVQPKVLTPKNHENTSEGQQGTQKIVLKQEFQGPHLQREQALLPKGAVAFNEAGISLVPGGEWQRLESGSFVDVQSICPPVLKGEDKFNGNVIQVLSTMNRSDALSAAEVFNRKLSTHENVTKGSVNQEVFTSKNGIKGILISYEYLSKGERHDKKLQAHVYLFKNKNGKCVTINYVTLIEKNSDLIDRMIRDTLTLR